MIIGCDLSWFLNKGERAESCSLDGRSHTIYTVRIQQEGDDADIADPILVHIRFAVPGGDDDLLKEISAFEQRGDLLLPLVRVGDAEGGLDIGLFHPHVDDKIDLVHLFDFLSVLHLRKADRPHIHIVASDHQFIEQDILHQMIFLYLAEAQALRRPTSVA